VVYEICSFKSPISLSNISELFLKITKGKLDDLPYQYSKQLNMIYQKCMRRNPNERTSARELLKTAYFLDAIEKFITDKGLNINLQEKIPIKRYNIHNSKYERLKIKRKLTRDKNQDKKDSLLPKI
jgi:serine/threonine protein kinase